jgi:hypothetical protein
MGWGAFDLAIPGRGTVPRARSCGSSSRPGESPSLATKNIGPGNARREGHSPLCPALLRTAETPSLPCDLVGGAQSSAPAPLYGPLAHGAPLTCAAAPTAELSPSLPTPWRPDRRSAGKHPRPRRFPTRRTAPCIPSPNATPRAPSAPLKLIATPHPPKARWPKHPMGWTLALRLRTSTAPSCARGWPCGLYGSFLSVP